MKSRFLKAAVIMWFPLMLYLLEGPLEIYCGNMNEFNFPAIEFIKWFALILVMILIIGAFFLSLLPDKLYKCLSSFIFSFSFMSYIQNMLMNKYIFCEDGSRVNWGDLRGYSIVTTAIWVVLFLVIGIVPVILKKNELIHYASVVMGILLLVSCSVCLMNATQRELDDNRYVLSGEKQYSISSGDNIIVFILDRYPNVVFDDFCVQYPDALEVYKDFTYYDNAESCYAYTFPSLVHVLTGTDPDVKLSRREWFETAWNSDRCTEFYNLLHDKGYTCNLYSSEEAYVVMGDLGNLTGRFDNISKANPKANDKLLCELLFKMSIYKYAPYAVKPRFEIASSEVFRDVWVYENTDGITDYYNYEFNESLDSNGIIIDNSMDNTFSVIHLSGIHDFINDENGNYKEESTNDVYTTQVGLTNIMNKYFEELKALGVYDNTTIIIMSDHGYAPEKYAPQPIFMIKKKGQVSDHMEVSSAPISYDDFQATILELTGESDINTDYGTDIFDWSAGDIRERKCAYMSDGFYIYTYSGDRDNLIEKMESGEYEREESAEW